MASWRRVLLLSVFGLLSLTACGSVRPVPDTFNPTAYTPIDFDQLRLDAGSLRPGDLVRCQAFFWQFLTHDPSPEYYYFNQIRYPAGWRELEWFALYREADLQGYYDRGAMSFQQRLAFNPKRLDPVLLYGELVPMGGSQLYLRVHHLERVVID